ncbi:MAG: class I SAM-dependent methyltransferase [Chloroflexi bacterium]|nr:class I SAM-dependent methyltransferase [Chloroflexota bacterium]
MSHLDQFYAGRSYDAEYGAKSDDLPFWEAAARRYKPRAVLELAVGTGRIAVPLARLGAAQGFTVTGLDLVPAMLDEARRKLAAEPPAVQERLTLIHGDARTFVTGERFDLALIGFNSLMHLLTADDQLSAFAAVRRCLSPGGRFIVDVLNPSLPLLAEASQPSGAVRVDVVSEDAATGERLVKTSTARYLDAFQATRNRYSFERRGADGAVQTSVVEVEYHSVFPRELEVLCRFSGFEIENIYGGYGWEPFQPGSSRMIAVGRAIEHGDSGADRRS